MSKESESEKEQIVARRDELKTEHEGVDEAIKKNEFIIENEKRLREAEDYQRLPALDSGRQ